MRQVIHSSVKFAKAHEGKLKIFFQLEVGSVYMLLFILQIHGKDAVLAYDSDDESIDAENTSVASPSSANTNGGPTHNNNNNNNNTSSHVTGNNAASDPLGSHAGQHVGGGGGIHQSQASLSQAHSQSHHSASAASSQSSSSLTSLYHPSMAATQHVTTHPGYASHYANNQMTHQMDFKPQYLADWYSHPYHTAITKQATPHHVSAALPTPPSTGHSPVQSLGSHHLPILPASSTAYT